MEEYIIKLDVPALLPGVEDHQDQCLAKLESALRAQRGIQKAHLKREGAPIQLCIHYNPQLISFDEIQRITRSQGAGLIKRYHHLKIPIRGMDCSDCALVVEHSLSRLTGVLRSEVSYTDQSMSVEYDSYQTNRRVIENRIRQLGYEVPISGLERWLQQNQEVILSLLSGLALLLGWISQSLLGLPLLAGLGLYLVSALAGGFHIARHAWHTLRQRKFDTDLLMLLAALGAAAVGEFAEGALLLFLFSLGHALEERTLDRARVAIQSLADLAPKTALVQHGENVAEIAVDRVNIDDRVIIRPGARVPVDGEVIAGQSAVNQSPVTGESAPVEKSRGDLVFAGSVNGEGALEVRATRLARDSTLARVAKMVAEAQGQKSPSQRVTERFIAIFVPTVLVVVLLLILVPPLFGEPFSVSFLRAMTVLVATSPCALALGTPAAILSGVAQAARNGVLVKGGLHLENLGRLNAIAFDKTGTITRGVPEVTDILTSGQLSENSLLALTAAVETRSAHPLAKAVVAAAAARGLDLPQVEEVSAVNGSGIQAVVEGRPVWVGNLSLLERSGFELPAEILKRAHFLQDQGKTVMFIGWDRGLEGLIAVADKIRPEFRATLASLRELGIRKFIMLTGDNDRVAAHIAGLAGLTDFRAGLLPEDKLTAIHDLVEEHSTVAMVGDGVNDAPALAHASIGIAMGGAGTDVALETADIALMGDDLSKLPFAIRLGQATRLVIQQNLVISLGVIVGLVSLALTGLAGIGLAILLHEGSTLLVVLNALRLLRKG